MSRETTDETIRMRLTGGNGDLLESSEVAFAATVAKERIEARDDRPQRPRTAEFMPHTRMRDTGECTVKSSEKWDSASGLALLRTFGSAVHRVGNRQLAAVAIGGAVVTAVAAVLAWRSVTGPAQVSVGSPYAAETRVGTINAPFPERTSASEPLISAQPHASIDAKTQNDPGVLSNQESEEPVRLRDAVDALVNGHMDEARRIYRSLASLRPGDKATVLAAEILSRTARPEER